MDHSGSASPSTVDWMSVPDSHVQNLMPKKMVLGGGTFGCWIDHEGRTLITEIPREIPCTFCHVRTMVRGWQSATHKRNFTTTQPCWHPDLRPQPLELGGIHFSCLYSLWYFVRAAWMNEDTKEWVAFTDHISLLCELNCIYTFSLFSYSVSPIPFLPWPESSSGEGYTPWCGLSFSNLIIYLEQQPKMRIYACAVGILQFVHALLKRKVEHAFSFIPHTKAKREKPWPVSFFLERIVLEGAGFCRSHN